MKIPVIRIDKFFAESQIKKILEEFKEFENEIYQTEEELAELFDIIQSCITYIYHVYKQKQINDGSKAHYNKLVERGHKIEKIIHIEIEDKHII